MSITINSLLLLYLLLLANVYCEIIQQLIEEEDKINPNDASDTNDPNAFCIKNLYGIFADYSSGCQVYHICHGKKLITFKCPSGTLFNQQLSICDHWFNVQCSPNSAHNPTTSPEKTTSSIYPQNPSTPPTVYMPGYQPPTYQPPNISPSRDEPYHSSSYNPFNNKHYHQQKPNYAKTSSYYPNYPDYRPTLYQPIYPVISSPEVSNEDEYDKFYPTIKPYSNDWNLNKDWTFVWLDDKKEKNERITNYNFDFDILNELLKSQKSETPKSPNPWLFPMYKLR